MSPKRRYKPRARRSAGHRLMLFIMAKGGSATKLEISRHSADGRLLANAMPELGDLIAIESTRGKASKRPATRISLTLKGLAAAQALRPDWQPRRLATPILKAWIDELAAESDLWAMGILRDAEDARNWRAHEQKIERNELVCEPPRPKARPRGRPYVAQGIHGPSTRELPPTPKHKPQPPPRSIWGGGFTSPQTARPIRSAPATPPPQAKQEDAAEARKEELRKHCVICSDGGADIIEHDCSRFQAA